MQKKIQTPTEGSVEIDALAYFYRRVVLDNLDRAALETSFEPAAILIKMLSANKETQETNQHEQTNQPTKQTSAHLLI